MKKFNVKSGLCGFMAGVTAMCAVPAVAKDIQTTISVAYKNIKIYADGNLVNTSDSNEAFIYNGTTYLPVRAVGEAFNKAVNWDGKNSAVYIGTQPASMEQPTVLLENLDYFTKTANFIELAGDKDNTAAVHSGGIQFYNSYGGEVQYLLNAKYTKFSGIIGIHYDQRDSSRERVVKVYGDNKLLYTSPILTSGAVPTKFNIDVTGVINLKIEFDNGGAYERGPCIFDAGFYA